MKGGEQTEVKSPPRAGAALIILLWPNALCRNTLHRRGPRSTSPIHRATLRALDLLSAAFEATSAKLASKPSALISISQFEGQQDDLAQCVYYIL